jgi:hypothetical protein
MNSIQDICKQYKIENYTINDDGSIDVNGDVNLSWLGITELPLRFNKVTGDFFCSHNNLTSLKGCPRWVGGFFNCIYNQLTSLEFSPDYVGGYFSCRCNKLTDNYCDTEIKDTFITSLKQEGLIFDFNKRVVNYNEWRKLYKRKQTLNELYTRNM